MIEVKCDYCGKYFMDYPSNVKRHRRHYCNKHCESESRRLNNTSEHWIGGTVLPNGYKYIKINGKQREEHRLVMERYLGRELRTDEHIHHKDGNKLNNSIDNLLLISNSEHAKLHSKKPLIKECKKCMKVRKIHGRGLCANCYGSLLRKGELNKYELEKKQVHEQTYCY